MDRPLLADLNPTDPAELARDTAHELVRAAVAVANLCDERREARGVLTAEQLVDDLGAALAERLVAMMRVFDADDLNTMLLMLGEAIDQVGFGDGLDLRDTAVFRRWADPGAFVHEPPEVAEDLAHTRAELLGQGVVVLDDCTHRGARTVTATGPNADHVRDAIASVAPRATVDWAGPAPRRLVPVPAVAFRERDQGMTLRVYVPLEAGEHVDEIHVAEDEDTVAVLVTVCVPAAPTGIGMRLHIPHRVHLEAPLGARTVVDGATGGRLRRDGD